MTYSDSQSYDIWADKPTLITKGNGKLLLTHRRNMETISPEIDVHQRRVLIGCTVVSFDAAIEIVIQILKVR